LTELPSIGFSGDMSKTVVPDRAGKRKYRDLGHLAKYVPNKLENLRGAHPQYNNKEIYDDLINILLNAKKDITRIEGLDDYVNATKYAQKHGYRITNSEEDINHDGVNDIVLYDKKGNPIIVNGYKLSPSKQPLRKLYEKAKREQTLTDPAAGYRGYVKQLYGVEGDFDENGKRNVRFDKTNLPPDLQQLKLHGWSIPTAPKKEQSVHQRIMAHIRNWYESFCDANFTDKEWVKKSLPRFKIFSIVYILLIDRELWNTLDIPTKMQIKARADEINNDTKIAGANVSIYDAFKAYKDANKAQCKQFILDNWTAITGTNLDDFFGSILNDLKFTDDLIKRLPTDRDIRRFDPAHLTDFKTKKRHFMNTWDRLADATKDSVISTIFTI
jgi:hypothetical protein